MLLSFIPKRILIVVLCLQNTLMFSQNSKDSLNIITKTNYLKDTIFYDINWIISERNQAAYYRLIKKTKRGYLVNDFYINGNPQMKARYSSIAPEIKHGKCIYYHTNGKIESEGHYYNDTAVGYWYYHNTKGRFTHQKKFKDAYIPTYDSSSWKPQNQSSLLIANVNYRFNFNNSQINSGHGLGLEFGFNLGYFISQKFLFAPFVGMGMRDLFYQTKFTSGYVQSFNNNYYGNTLTGNDSIVVNYMKNLINSKGYFHERNSYAGVMMRLPFKYMPIIKLYTGESSLAYKTLNETIQLKPYVSGDKKTDNDYFDITRRMNWGAEIFLYNGRTRVRNYDNTVFSVAQCKRLKWSTNLLALSVYIQEFDTYHSHFTFSDGYHDVSVSMSTFMNSSFMQSHKKDYFIGLRLSYGVF